MINKKLIGLLGLATRAGKLISGTNACIYAIKRKRIDLIIVAEDASDRTKKNFELLCKENEIEIIIFGSIEEISKSIGQSNKAVIGIKDKNFTNEILKEINGGEIIG